MNKYISLDKRSKKAQREYHAKQRCTWGELNPVTRSVPSGKTYNRKKEKQRLLRASGTCSATTEAKRRPAKSSEVDLMPIFFSSLYQSMESYREYEKFSKCSKCELKPWCRGCPAVAKGTNGDFFAADPQCWKIKNEITGEVLSC